MQHPPPCLFHESAMPESVIALIVVGAGPVGLTAALAWGGAAFPRVLLAAEPELAMELRGSTFHPPTLDLLDEFGVVPHMIEVGLKAPTWQFRDRETGPVATFDLSLLAGDTNHPYRVQCEQWKLMRLLRGRIAQAPRHRHPLRSPGDGGAAGRGLARP